MVDFYSRSSSDNFFRVDPCVCKGDQDIKCIHCERCQCAGDRWRRDCKGCNRFYKRVRREHSQKPKVAGCGTSGNCDDWWHVSPSSLILVCYIDVPCRPTAEYARQKSEVPLGAWRNEDPYAGQGSAYKILLVSVNGKAGGFR